MNDNLNDVIQVIKQVHNKDISQFDESFLLKSLSKRAAVKDISRFPGDILLLVRPKKISLLKMISFIRYCLHHLFITNAIIEVFQ